MDPSDLNRLLRTAGVDLWSLIDAAIAAAAEECRGDELRARRDAIVERLYASSGDRCRSCAGGGTADGDIRPPATSVSPASSPESVDGDGEGEGEGEEERRGRANDVEEEKRKIIGIRDLLEESDQSDESVGSLLQNLLDMNITFRALKETDIGRHVNRMRKHPSGEVRQLAKLLVREWKDIVDEWVKFNPNGSEMASPAIIADADSPQEIPKKLSQNGQQIQELEHSPNPQNGCSSNGVEQAQVLSRAKTSIPSSRREPPAKSRNSISPSTSVSAVKEPKDLMLDPDRLASARKRLQENYQEAQNAKKQRTIQVMDIHEIPKPKGSLARKGGFQAKHW